MAKKIDPKVKKSIDEIVNSTEDARNLVEDMFNSFKKGGTKGKAILKEFGKLFSGLTDSTSKATKGVSGIGDAANDTEDDIEDMTDAQLKFVDVQKILAGYDGPRLKASGLISKNLAAQLGYTESITKSRENLNKLNKSDLSTQNYIKTIQEDLNKAIDQNSSTLQNQLAIWQSIDEYNKSLLVGQVQYAQALKDVEASAYNVGSSLFRAEDYTSEIAESMQRTREMEAERAKILSGNTSLTGQQREDALANLESNISISAELTKQLTALQKASEAYDKINSKAIAIRDTIMTPVDKLFGIVPSGISKMLGLDTFQSAMKEKVGKAIGTAMMESSSAITGFFSAASAGASALAASIAPILLPLLAIAGLVGIVKLFMDADKAVSQLATDLNISYKQAIDVKDQAVEIAAQFGNLGIKSDDVTRSMVELSKATGLNVALMSQHNDKAKNLVETTTMLNKLYGTTTEEAMALNTAAALTGTTVDKLAATAAVFGNELMPAQELIRDIGKVSKGVLMTFHGNTKALIKSVMQAKILGTTLDKMQAIGEKMMDFESSIAAQNKARVFLGKQINTDAIRYYYITGQTEKMQDAIVQQMGSAHDYLKMGNYQKKIYAEALGMEKSDLDEMMSKQLELETMGITQVELQEMLNKVKDGTLSSADALAKIQSGEGKQILQNMLRDQKRQGVMAKMADTWAKIEDILYRIVEPLLEKIDAYVASLGDGAQLTKDTLATIDKWGHRLSMIFDVSVALFKGIWTPLKFTFDIIYGIVSKIANLFSGMKDSSDGVTKSADNMNGSLEGIKVISSAIGIIIGSWFVLSTIKAVVSGFKSMYDSAKDIASSLKDTFSKVKDGKFSLFGKDKKPNTPEVSDSSNMPEVNEPAGAEKLGKTKYEGFKDNMRNLADGLKAMGEDGVGKGIFNMAMAGPALLLAVPAIPMLLFMGKVKLDNLFNNFYNLASGLTAMGDAGRQGIANIALAGPALLLGLAGLPFIIAFNAIDTSKLITNFTNLAGGLDAMSGGIAGVGVLAAFAVAAIVALPSLVFLGGIALLGEAGAAGMIALGGGLEALGAVASTGLPFVAVGLIAALGVAMIPFAAALKIAAPALQIFADMIVGVFSKLPPIIDALANGVSKIIDTIGSNVTKIISTVSESIAKMGEINPLKLIGLGYGLAAVGAGLLALTAGEIVNGIASFFGADPVDTLKELENIDGAKLKLTGDGLVGMSSALSKLSNLDADPIIKINESIKPISDIDNDSISVTAVSISDLALAFGKLNDALNKLPADAAKKIKDITDAAANSTNNQFSDLPGSILTGLESIKNKIANAIKSPFEHAFNYLDEVWLGHSPSEIGTQMQVGISSVQPKISKSITNTFKKIRKSKPIKYFANDASKVSKFGKSIYDGVDSAINPGLSDSIESSVKGMSPDSLSDYKSMSGKSQSIQQQEHSASIDALRKELLGVSKPANDLVSAPTKKQGYGNRVLLAPEGTFSFNNQDSIVAGTDLMANSMKVNDFASTPNVLDILKNSKPIDIQGLKKQPATNFTKKFLPAQSQSASLSTMASTPDFKGVPYAMPAGYNPYTPHFDTLKMLHPEMSNFQGVPYAAQKTKEQLIYENVVETANKFKNIDPNYQTELHTLIGNDETGKGIYKTETVGGVKLDYDDVQRRMIQMTSPDKFKELYPDFKEQPETFEDMVKARRKSIKEGTYVEQKSPEQKMMEQATPSGFEMFIRGMLPGMNIPGTGGLGDLIFGSPAENYMKLKTDAEQTQVKQDFLSGKSNVVPRELQDSPWAEQAKQTNQMALDLAKNVKPGKTATPATPAKTEIKLNPITSKLVDKEELQNSLDRFKAFKKVDDFASTGGKSTSFSKGSLKLNKPGKSSMLDTLGIFKDIGQFTGIIPSDEDIAGNVTDSIASSNIGLDKAIPSVYYGAQALAPHKVEQEKHESNAFVETVEFSEKAEEAAKVAKKIHSPTAKMIEKFNPLHQIEHGAVNLWESIEKEGIGGTLSKGLDTLKSIGKPAAKVTTEAPKGGFWSGLMESGSSMLSKGWEGLKSTGSNIISGGSNLLSKGKEGISSIGTSLSESGIGGTLSKGWEGLKSGGTSMLSKGWEGIKGGIGGIGKSLSTGWLEGGGALFKGIEAGGLKGLAGAAGTGLKNFATKGNVIGALIGGVVDTGLNIAEGKDWKESLGRAAISGLTSFAGGALGSLLLPGAGTVAGGMAGGMLGDKLGDMLFGEKKEADDLFSPGYGERTLTTPEGTYGLNDKDNIVASTNPPVMPIMQQPATVTAAPASDQSAAPAGPAANNNQSLKNVEALLQQLVSQTAQPATIRIGDMAIKEIGTQLHFNQSYNAMINSHRS